MTRFVHIDYPTVHPGVERIERVVQVFTAAISKSWQQWRQARIEAENDRRMWEVALSDARVMAEISRSMEHVSPRARRLMRNDC